MNGERDRNQKPLPRGGPTFIVPGLWAPTEGNPGNPISTEDRAALALIATIARYRRGEIIYQAGAQADFVFNVVEGTIKSYTVLPNGRTHLVGFMFASDVCGLAEDGKYVNTVEAVTKVTLYKMSVIALERLLRRDANMDFQVIGKLCHELRETQRHAILLSHHRAIERLCLFLQMLEAVQVEHGGPHGKIFLTMSRSDIAAYIGVSPEVVSRCMRELARRQVISIIDRRHVRIVNPTLFDAILSGDEDAPQ